MYALSHLLSNDKLDLDILYEIMKSAYYSFAIPVSLFNNKHNKIKGYGHAHDLFLQFPDLSEEYLSHVKRSIDSAEGPILHVSSFHVQFLTIPLKHNRSIYGYIALGPFQENVLSEHQLNQLIQSKGLLLSERNQFKHLFSRIPAISKIRLFHIEKTLIALLESPYTIDPNSANNSEDKSQNISINSILTSSPNETASLFLDYPFELLFLDKVITGDIEQVFALYYEYIHPLFLGQLKADFIDNQVNAIILNTLLSRKVIQSDVDVDYALRLSHQFVTAIKNASSQEELRIIIEDMISKYTNSVLHIDSINHVGVIKKASKYVHNHLSEPIRLQDVADYIGLSPNYFSSLFKKEMDLAFADYVNHIRIKESQYLLKTSDQSILDIALSVGFNNQNYYTTIFKKVTGITPKQYRIKT